jgi:hypothetical protein
MLFGVAPGDIDRMVKRAAAKLSRDGRVRVVLDGLVLAEGANAGTNPIPQIAATLFCNGAPVATTTPVAFSPDGHARIDQKLATAPPSPCLVPALLMNPTPSGTPRTGTYIAATGHS